MNVERADVGGIPQGCHSLARHVSAGNDGDRATESAPRTALMAHTYIANFTHYFFSTKDRKNTIPPELKEKLWAYLLGIANNLRIKTLAVGGTANHIHLLVALPPTMPIAEAAQKLKANSSRWLGEQGLVFQWQEGYGAFSVSPSLLEVVKRYIHNQEEHHRKRSFEEEFRALLDKAGVSYEAGKLFAA